MEYSLLVFVASFSLSLAAIVAYISYLYTRSRKYDNKDFSSYLVASIIATSLALASSVAGSVWLAVNTATVIDKGETYIVSNPEVLVEIIKYSLVFTVMAPLFEIAALVPLLKKAMPMTVVCPNCKKTVPASPYCESCGRKLLRVCPSCGHRIGPANDFCGNCGLKWA